VFDARTYRPAGPTLQRFHESSAFYRFVAGPIGSGKTTAAGVAEMPFTAMMQEPEEDGIRRAKVGILRDTYRNLYRTFIPTWHLWFPKNLGRFVGSDDRPAEHELELETPYGECHLRVEMLALGANSLVATCSGWELSGVYLDEMDGIPREGPEYLAGRVKRFPRKKYRRSRGVWGSFNKPDTDHWLYEVCMEGGLDGVEFFDQPGGLIQVGNQWVANPNAENLDQLDADYYTRGMGRDVNIIRRTRANLWSASAAGEAIYPEFSDQVHMSPVELEPTPGQTLFLGVDGGGTPAAVICGRDPYGRRVVYAEVVVTDPTDPKGRRLATGVGPKRFAEALKAVLHPRFRGCQVEIVYADPSMFYGADREAGEYADIEVIGQRLELPVTAAPSNEIRKRHEAVRGLLTDLRPDGRAALMINPSCRWVRRGFVSDYVWEPKDPKQPGKTLKPVKSSTSHIHDALQYAMLGDVGVAGVTGGSKHDRWQPTQGGLLVPTAPGVDTLVTRPQAVVKGTHYQVDFDLWRS
jgi:hypothetical protein